MTHLMSICFSQTRTLKTLASFWTSWVLRCITFPNNTMEGIRYFWLSWQDDTDEVKFLNDVFDKLLTRIASQNHLQRFRSNCSWSGSHEQELVCWRSTLLIPRSSTVSIASSVLSDWFTTGSRWIPWSDHSFVFVRCISIRTPFALG